MTYTSFVQTVCPPFHYSNLSRNTCARIPPTHSTTYASASKSFESEISPFSSSQSASQVNFVWLENNSFVLEFGKNRLLIDPWLTDDLVFLTPGFFKQKKAVTQSSTWEDFQIPAIDAIVLTQGIADHAHPPTLAKLPKTLPVLAPKSALPLLDSLGYTNVTQLTYGETVQPIPEAPWIQLTASKGSLVGPPWSDAQLGYIFSFRDLDCSDNSGNPFRIYHEPHGNHDFDFLQQYAGKLDVVLAPVIATKIPSLADYALVNGIPEALALCKATKPCACVPFDNSSGEKSGFLSDYLQTVGSTAEFVTAVSKEPSLEDMVIFDPPETLKPMTIASRKLRGTGM